jgi:DNA-binding CsgD family transcriptional regulator
VSRRGRPPHPDILTPREWEVLALLREGLSNPQIAERLRISRAGAKYHVAEILSKLGLSSREEAARWRREEGRPWWTAAFAPVASLWRRAGALGTSLSGFALALSGVLLLAIVLGLGLIAFLLMRGDGSGIEAEQPSSRWLDALRHVPNTDESRRWVKMNDHAEVRRILGIPVPDPHADEEELGEYVWKLLAVGPEPDDGGYEYTGLVLPEFLGSNHYPTRLADWKTELGFMIGDVDLDLETGSAHEMGLLDGEADGVIPPWIRYQLLRGRFERDAIDEAVQTDPFWGDLLSEESHRGVGYYAWGNVDRFEGPGSGPRRLGKGHCLALNDDYAYWMLSTDGIEQMIDAAAGERESLADVEEFRLLAQGLDSLDTYTALFTDDTHRFSESEVAQAACVPQSQCEEERLEAILAELRLQPHLLPFDAVATGAGRDFAGPYTAVILVHESEELARENVQRLKQAIAEGTSMMEVLPWGALPWSEIIHEFEVSSSGRLVLGKLYSEHSALWWPLVLDGDSLLLHADTAE